MVGSGATPPLVVPARTPEDGVLEPQLSASLRQQNQASEEK